MLTRYAIRRKDINCICNIFCQSVYPVRFFRSNTEKISCPLMNYDVTEPKIAIRCLENYAYYHF
jgi:hypothetical protein